MVPALIASDRTWSVVRLATASSFFLWVYCGASKVCPLGNGPPKLVRVRFGIISRDMQYASRLLAIISL